MRIVPRCRRCVVWIHRPHIATKYNSLHIWTFYNATIQICLYTSMESLGCILRYPCPGGSAGQILCPDVYPHLPLSPTIQCSEQHPVEFHCSPPGEPCQFESRITGNHVGIHTLGTIVISSSIYFHVYQRTCSTIIPLNTSGGVWYWHPWQYVSYQQSSIDGTWKPGIYDNGYGGNRSPIAQGYWFPRLSPLITIG